MKYNKQIKKLNSQILECENQYNPKVLFSVDYNLIDELETKRDALIRLRDYKPNRIFNEILEARKGHYCHALEIASVYEYESIIESIQSEFDAYALELIEFFENIEVYYYCEDIFCGNPPIKEIINHEQAEQELYNFNVTNHINEFYGDL